MTLTLRAISLNERPLSQPITACFDASGGTIGRADHNTLALPDPERHISRLQAEVSSVGKDYVIKNLGAANPIIVSGRPLVQGESMALSSRDQVRIGGYLLEVLNSDDDQSASNITRGRAAVDAHTQAGARGPEVRTIAPVRVAPAGASIGLADLASPLSSSNPFADLLGNPAPLDAAPPAALPSAPARAPAPAAAIDPFADLIPTPAGVAQGSAAFKAPPPPANRLPDDFDPFAPPPSAPSRGPAPAGDPRAAAAGPGEFSDLVPGGTENSRSIDDLFGLGAGAGAAGASADPLAGFLGGATAGPGSPASTDPLAMFGLQAPPAAAPALPDDRTPALKSAFAPPKVTPPAAGPSPAAPALPAAPAAAIPADVDWFGAAAASGTAGQSPAMPPASQAPAARSAPAAGGTTPAVAAPAAASDDPFAALFATPAVAPQPQAMPMAQPQDLPQAMPIVSPVVPAGAFASSAPTPAAAAFPGAAASVPPSPAAVAAMPAAVPSPPLAATPGAAAANPTTTSPADLQALWSAFCEGAGIDVKLPQTLSPEMMRVVGSLLHAAVEGTLQLMAVRAAAKHELRAAVTIIQARSNNPLKFSPDARNALEQMLQPPVRGFLPGPAAMTDAMHDLVGHSIGTMAGMRAALEGMLGRFTPDELERKLAARSVLDSVLPINRKAKLWDLYLQHFDTIRNEAQEDFHNLFGKAFLSAYEQQLDRLKASQKPGQP